MFPRRVRYVVLLVLLSVVVAGGWWLGRALFKPNPMAEFMERLQLPQYVPEWLNQRGGSMTDEVAVGMGLQVPGVEIRWSENPGDPPGIGVWLAQSDAEVDMDMTGQREPVEVDGVQGWLTRLAAADFLPPDDSGARLARSKEWAFDLWPYLGLQRYRIRGEKPYPPGLLYGPAIALQWNRDGIHYLLVAQDRAPMTVEELLRMANSMAPAEFPFLDFGKPPDVD